MRQFFSFFVLFLFFKSARDSYHRRPLSLSLMSFVEEYNYWSDHY